MKNYPGLFDAVKHQQQELRRAKSLNNAESKIIEMIKKNCTAEELIDEMSKYGTDHLSIYYILDYQSVRNAVSSTKAFRYRDRVYYLHLKSKGEI